GRYGREKAAMVANVITFRSKGSLRSVGKALGMPDSLLGAASKLISSKFHRQSNAENVLNGLESSPIKDEDDPLAAKEAMSLYGENIPWKLWSEMAERLKGFPRHLGIHSGGFMLADKPLNHLVAQEPATMENRSVVQWSKTDIEGLGFF